MNKFGIDQDSNDIIICTYETPGFDRIAHENLNIKHENLLAALMQYRDQLHKIENKDWWEKRAYNAAARLCSFMLRAINNIEIRPQGVIF